MPYSKNKHSVYIRERKYDRKDWLYESLEEMGELHCPDCGEKIEKDELCFHHPTEEKNFKILGYCLPYSKEKILEEVALTIPMHLQCHARREGLIQTNQTEKLDEYPLKPLGTEVTEIISG